MTDKSFSWPAYTTDPDPNMSDYYKSMRQQVEAEMKMADKTHQLEEELAAAKSETKVCAIVRNGEHL